MVENAGQSTFNHARSLTAPTRREKFFSIPWPHLYKHLSIFTFRYAGPKDLTVIQWIQDLADRMKQLQTVSKLTNTSGAKELKNLKVWLGGLFIPEAYVTATRQFVAQANQWSLEELYLNITIADSPGASPKVDDCSFIVSGKNFVLIIGG